MSHRAVLVVRPNGKFTVRQIKFFHYHEVELRTLARSFLKMGPEAGRNLARAMEIPMLGHWILDENLEPQQTDLETWARWFEKADRRVAYDEVGPMVVSTVFLGIDHGHGRSNEPVLYETMILGGYYEEHDEEYQVRAHTRAEALVEHTKAREAASSHCPADYFEREAMKVQARVQRARKGK